MIAPSGIDEKSESKCGNCRFWESAGRPSGRCRRVPPVIVSQLVDEEMPDMEWATRFPETDKTDWCGEFSHKDRMP